MAEENTQAENAAGDVELENEQTQQPAEGAGEVEAPPTDPNEGLREWEKVVPLEMLQGGGMDDVGTPFLEAAREHNFDRMKNLFNKGANINDQHEGGDLKGMSALHWLAGDGYAEEAQWLIDHGIDIHMRDAWGQTALHHAAGNGQLDCMKLLVKAGLDIHDMDDAFGQDALHWAAAKNKTEVVQWLLDQGAQVTRHDNDGGLTALHIAAQAGIEDNARLLIEHGADLDAVDEYDKTPLMTAGGAGQAEIVKMLLEAGSSLTATDKKGQTFAAAYASLPEIKEVYDAHVERLKTQKSTLKRLYMEGVQEWDVDEVAEWLEYMKLDDYVDDFRSKHVDGPRLLADGGALLADPKQRSVLDKGLFQAQKHHQHFLDMKREELKMDMALSALTTIMLAFLIVRFFRRLFQ